MLHYNAITNLEAGAIEGVFMSYLCPFLQNVPLSEIRLVKVIESEKKYLVKIRIFMFEVNFSNDEEPLVYLGTKQE